MIIKNLEIRGFRNFNDFKISPCDGINVIYGPNAQGKTNLIEAIWLFTGAKSFRGAKDSELINFNSNGAKITLDFLGEGTEKNAVIEIEKVRSAFLNDKKLQSPSKLAGKFHAIVFSPLDLSLIKDGPKVRRRFLDICIGQLYPGYIDILLKYTRAIAQRNSVLRDAKYHSDLLGIIDAFDEEIIPLGEKITDYRKRYTKMLCGIASEIYSGISSNKENLQIEYACSYDEPFSDALKKSRKNDILLGVTSLGPHRDDLIFKINSADSRSFASQGQQRSIALTLKLSQAQVIKNICGEYPVALLDDVFSELDPKRQDYILNHIKQWQVFITCCDPSNVKNLEEGKIFRIENGAII